MCCQKPIVAAHKSKSKLQPTTTIARKKTLRLKYGIETSVRMSNMLWLSVKKLL